MVHHLALVLGEGITLRIEHEVHSERAHRVRGSEICTGSVFPAGRTVIHFWRRSRNRRLFGFLFRILLLGLGLRLIHCCISRLGFGWFSLLVIKPLRHLYCNFLGRLVWLAQNLKLAVVPCFRLIFSSSLVFLGCNIR